eukprot:322844-Alexandrium_andersonii.AAC.1
MGEPVPEWQHRIRPKLDAANQELGWARTARVRLFDRGPPGRARGPCAAGARGVRGFQQARELLAATVDEEARKREARVPG